MPTPGKGPDSPTGITTDELDTGTFPAGTIIETDKSGFYPGFLLACLGKDATCIGNAPNFPIGQLTEPDTDDQPYIGNAPNISPEAVVELIKNRKIKTGI